MADILTKLDGIVDDELAEEIDFVCQMVGITPEEFIIAGIKQQMDSRLELPEFAAQIGRHMESTKEIADRLSRKHGVRRRQMQPKN